MTSNAQ